MIADDMQILKEGKKVDIEEEFNGRFYSTIKFPIQLKGKPRYLAGYTIDITERKLAERELKERNDELTRFAYAVSHDLKSPLVTITTFLDYLEEDIKEQNAEGAAGNLGYIRTAADKMCRLLKELQELSRVGRNMQPAVEMPLGALLEEALALAAGRISKRGIKTRITGETVTLSGDRQRLLEVFQNLFDNAAKFMGAQPDPLIEAGVDLSGAEPVFFVRDNGIGIDPLHQGRIFGLFEKLDPATEGTGMGLALARRIIEVHGGRIWVESEGVGKGTTFRFTLAKIKKG
jgi:signal transduction histidine kinase